MKEIYYYIRDRDNRPRITVCLLKKTFRYDNLEETYFIEISKGIAFCSDKDIPCKKVGRKIAKERSLCAMKNKEDNCMINRYSNISMPDSFKSCYMPVLSEYEDKLLNFERKRKELKNQQNQKKN